MAGERHTMQTGLRILLGEGRERGKSKGAHNRLMERGDGGNKGERGERRKRLERDRKGGLSICTNRLHK